MMNRRNFVFNAVTAAAGLSAFSRLSVSQRPSTLRQTKIVDYSSVIDRFKDRLPGLMTQYHIPGLAIALIDGQRLVWSQGFGYTDKSQRLRVTDETLFSVQSTSKTYTAMGVLVAASKGRLRLDDRLSRFMPGFRVNSRFGRGETQKITIRRLLSHWAGFCHEAPLGNNFDNCSCTFEEHIRSISNSWLVAPVGHRFSYSNLGIDLAGYILQLQSRKPFETYLSDEVFKPLGMTASTFSQSEALKNSSFAIGHRGENELPIFFIPMIPAGGMYSCVRDLASFVMFCLRDGEVNGSRLISEDLLKEMTTPQFPVEGQNGGYGLGIFNVASFGATKLLHSGGGYGYSADQRWMPDYGIGAVVLTNQQRGLAASALTNSALELMIRAKYGDIPQVRAIASVNRPVFSLAPELLRRLEGTYKAGGLVTFRVEGDQLFQIVGNEKQRLDAHSRTEFTSAQRRYTFDLDRNGKPKGVQVVAPNYNSNGAEYWGFNDSPTDELGPNRREWSDYIGHYAGKSYGSSIETNVSIRNGHLYTNWGGGLRLKEHGQGIFFNAEGEAVIFQGNRMSLGNRPFVKSN